MSSNVRSLEDAADYIIDVLKGSLQINSLYIVTSTGAINRIVKAFNSSEQFIDLKHHLPLLQSYAEVIIHHATPMLSIPNTMEDVRTANLPLTSQLGACALTGTPIISSDKQIIGAICALDREAIELRPDQAALLLSLSHLIGYILELENESVTDSLTGLYNRRYLQHLYQHSPDKQYSVMFIDIDNFKEVNDNFGHDFGDLLLLEISKRLKHSVRKTDILLRYGGDEFLICFHNLCENQDIQIVADKIKESISKPIVINGQAIHVSASIGISSSCGGSSHLKELISDADQAMYDNKQTEKNL